MVGSAGPKVGGKAGKAPRFIDELETLLAKYADIDAGQVRETFRLFGTTLEAFDAKKREAERAQAALDAREADLVKREAAVARAKAALSKMGAELERIEAKLARETPDLRLVPQLEAG